MRSIPRGDTFININRYTRCHVAVSQRFENTPRASCVSARNTPPMINGQKRRERWAFGIFSLIYPRFVCSPFWIRSSFFFPLVVAKPSSSLLRISRLCSSRNRADKSNCTPSRRSPSRSTRRLRHY